MFIEQVEWKFRDANKLKANLMKPWSTLTTGNLQTPDPSLFLAFAGTICLRTDQLLKELVI